MRTGRRVSRPAADRADSIAQIDTEADAEQMRLAATLAAGSAPDLTNGPALQELIGVLKRAVEGAAQGDSDARNIVSEAVSLTADVVAEGLALTGGDAEPLVRRLLSTLPADRVRALLGEALAEFAPRGRA